MHRKGARWSHRGAGFEQASHCDRCPSVRCCSLTTKPRRATQALIAAQFMRRHLACQDLCQPDELTASLLKKKTSSTFHRESRTSTSLLFTICLHRIAGFSLHSAIVRMP